VTVDAAGAQALIGHVREGGRSTKHLAADVKNGFCSLVLVPLDGKPLAQSSRMLLAATGWCGNTDMKWNEERNAIPGWGRGPVLIEPVTGAVTLRGLDAKSLRARALTAAGAPTDAAIPVAASSGAFTLTLGTPAATMVLIESGR
jgi:hypothetical protein